jgi:hypothetical protein
MQQAKEREALRPWYPMYGEQLCKGGSRTARSLLTIYEWANNFVTYLQADGQTLQSSILAPVTVLVLWTLVMCGWLYASRIPALKKHNVVYDPHHPSEAFHAQLPASVRWKADNYNNLLEQPTIFYVVALTLMFLNAGSGFNTGLAWAYVALRIAHSLVQALFNKVMIRFALFAAASLVLLTMAVRAAWIIFLA